MSQHRKNSVRDKIIGKKWIYWEKNTPQSVGHWRRQEWPWNIAWLVFMGWVIWKVNDWEDYSNYFGEGVEISRNWATTHFSVFMVDLRTVTAPVGVLFSFEVLQWVYAENQGLVEVDSSASWTYLVLVSLCCVLRLSNVVPWSLPSCFNSTLSRGEQADSGVNGVWETYIGWKSIYPLFWYFCTSVCKLEWG